MAIPRKLIVTGCARSGTTLLHSLMGYFKGVKVYRYAETLPARFNEKFQAKFADGANDQHSGKQYVVIKRPQFHPGDERYFTIEDLLRDDYRVINIVRDCRDVLVSRHPDDPSIYWVEPERWLAAVGETLRHDESPDVLTLKYEDLVMEPDQCMTDIADFLKTEYSPDYINFFRGDDARSYLDKAVMDGARAIHAGSIGNWRSPEHAARVQTLMTTRGNELKDGLVRLGYAL